MMKLRILSPALGMLLATLTGPAPAAAASQAEAALRAGNAAEALQLLRSGADALTPEEAAYWQGQALARLGRPEEAAECFHRVPAEHALFPYAARGLIYCAWVSPAINLVEVCAPLTVSPHEDIAALALAALAEHQLRYAPGGDTASFTQLEKLAAAQPEYAPLVKLLTIHLYRRAGEYDAGLEYARTLEHEAELTPTMRQRVRLAIAELYYDKEAAQVPPASEAEESDEGKGEETLLQFITANPDSPLLQEAFRRLQLRGAVGGSEYTRSKLLEWAEDTAHPRRAALAFFAQQLATQDSATIANRAASLLPGEPLTLTILHEQARRLHEQGKDDQAALYLALLPSLEREVESPHSLFSQARQIWRDKPGEALQLYRRCAERADASLYTQAIVNELICRLRLGDMEGAQRMLQEPAAPPTRRELLMAHAGYVAAENPALARRELDEVMSLHPTPAQATDVLLDRCCLTLAENPQEALAALKACCRSDRKGWSEAQALRYAGLLEAAADRAESEAAAEQALMSLYSESEAPGVKRALALHLAARFSAEGQHEKALQLLRSLAAQQPAGEEKAQSLFYAAQESAKLGTLAALEHAVRLYAESARQDTAMSASATIAQAAVLVRINRTTEAFDILYRLQQKRPNLAPAEQAMLLTVQADAYGQQHTAEGTASALQLCDKIAELPGLSPAWYARALLQRASLCAHSSRHAEALEAYRKVMQSERLTASPADEHSCFVYYYAGAGAVYQLLQLERYREAALLAEEVAAWPGTPGQPADARGPKSEAFARWAQSIRQTHYLPTKLNI